MNLRCSFWLSTLMGIALADPALAVRVRIPDGTPVRVRLKAELSSDRVAQSDRVDFEVAQDVAIQGAVVIPEGSVVWGAVQSVKKKEIKFDIEGVRLPSLQQIKLRSIREKTSNPGKDQIKIETPLGNAVGAAKGTEFLGYLDEDAEVEAAVPTSSPAQAPKPAPSTPPAQIKPVAPVEVKPVSPTEAKPSAPAEAKAPAPAEVKQPSPAPSVQPTPVAVPPASVNTLPAAPAPAPAAQPATPQPALSQPAPAVSMVAAQPAAPAAQVTTPAPAPAPPPVSPSAILQDWLTATERVTVECYSDPLGADILIDGEFVGNTPSILKVPVGDHRLEIRHSGYKTVTHSLILTVGMGLRTIRAPLEKRE